MSEPAVLPEGQEAFKLNEVCKLANVQPYMLRFWGTEFPALEASKSGTGQRLYNRDQVELILEVRRLLFDEGLTIAGARKRIGTRAQAVEPLPEEEREHVSAKAKKQRSTARRAASAKPKQVDKDDPKRVQHLLSTLRDVRTEIAKIMADIEPQ